MYPLHSIYNFYYLLTIYYKLGCTGYIQPLDTYINKVLKDKIAIYLEDLLDKELLQPVSSSNIRQCWIALTQAIGKA